MEGVSPPTLRFYGWEKPSISIGYAMNAETEVNLPLCRERDVPVVRRITGGGLVFHKCDTTYTVVFPDDFNPGGSRKRLSVLESYPLVNQAPAADWTAATGPSGKRDPRELRRGQGRRLIRLRRGNPKLHNVAE
jgi:lipoate-protein ligase A